MLVSFSRRVEFPTSAYLGSRVINQNAFSLHEVEIRTQLVNKYAASSPRRLTVLVRVCGEGVLAGLVVAFFDSILDTFCVRCFPYPSQYPLLFKLLNNSLCVVQKITHAHYRV